MRDFAAGLFLGAVGLLALEITGVSLWLWRLAIGEWLETRRITFGPIYLGDLARWGRLWYYRLWHGVGWPRR